MAGLSGIVLAGGQSWRMGRDKADIVVGGRTLLERAADLIAALCDDVVIVGRGSPPRPGAWAIPDEAPGLGPLGGLCTGLAAVSGDRALCIGIDLPLLTVDLLGRLIAAAADHEAAVFKLGEHVEPLPGVYARRIRPLVERHIREERYRMHDLLGALDTVYVALEPSPQNRAALLNVNAPEALEQARRLISD